MKRPTNEDYCHAETLIIQGEETGFFAVADGMGGHNKGEVASKMAIDKLRTYVFRHLEDNAEGVGDLKIMLSRAFYETNKLVYEKANKEEQFAGMGTTLIAAIINSNNLIVANVGDSRAYAVGNHRVELLTEDDSWCNKVIKAGIMSASEAKEHPRAHIITQCLGIKNTLINVHTSKIKLKSDEGLLLCTDGLYNMTDILPNSWKNPANIEAWLLVCNANRGGGIDNITIAISKA